MKLIRIGLLSWRPIERLISLKAQSLNILCRGDVSKNIAHEIHFKAWKKGIKSLYYSRSTSIQRADKVSHAVSTDKGMAELEKK